MEVKVEWREGEETVELQIVPVGVLGVDQRVVPAREKPGMRNGLFLPFSITKA